MRYELRWVALTEDDELHETPYGNKPVLSFDVPGRMVRVLRLESDYAQVLIELAEPEPGKGGR